jgi:hypothetical protein
MNRRGNMIIRLYRLLSWRFSAFTLSLILPLLASSADQPTAPAAGPSVTYDAEAMRRWSLHEMMVKVWEDYLIWLRNYLISSMSDLPDKDAVQERLLRTQISIGNLFRSFYGVAAGEKLNGLLKDHILIFADVAAAAKAGNATQRAEAVARWNKNMDDLAVFLHEANPRNWSIEDMQKMLHEHLQLILDDVAARARARDYADDVADFDKVHRQTMKMAHLLSAGIANQFPGKATVHP